MCVNTRYPQSAEETAEIAKSILFKDLYVRIPFVIQEPGGKLRYEKYLETPYLLFPVELDRVYYETSNEEIPSRGSKDSFKYKPYKKSFHAYRTSSHPLLFGSTYQEIYNNSQAEAAKHTFSVPAIIEDVQAYDQEQVAGRIMYLFSQKTWEAYQERKPIHVLEDEIIVETTELV